MSVLAASLSEACRPSDNDPGGCDGGSAVFGVFELTECGQRMKKAPLRNFPERGLIVFRGTCLPLMLELFVSRKCYFDFSSKVKLVDVSATSAVSSEFKW